MTATAKLGLELLQNAAANQILANTTFAQLNQLVQASVLDKDLSTPPASPADEALYIIGASPTGAWAGKANQLAYWLTSVGAWAFIPPKAGWQVAVLDEVDSNNQPARYSYSGSAWGLMAGGGGSGIPNPMTAVNDLIIGGSSGTPTRLAAPSSAGFVLTFTAAGIAWAAASGGGGGMANPMTAAGDLIIGASGGSPTALAVGNAGQVLTVINKATGQLGWVTPSSSGGGSDPTKLSLSGGTMTGAFNEAEPKTVSGTTIIPNSALAVANTIHFNESDLSLIGADPSAYGAIRRVVFVQETTIHHDSTALRLITSANIIAAPNDVAVFECLGASNWRMVDYSRFDGSQLVSKLIPKKLDATPVNGKMEYDGTDLWFVVGAIRKKVTLT